MKIVLLALLAGPSSAFTVAPAHSVRPKTQLKESFGFDFAEDSYGNQPDPLAGEAAYKTWVNTVSDNPMLNRQVR